MTNFFRLLILLLMMTSAAWAQYDLDWEHVHTTPANATVEVPGPEATPVEASRASTADDASKPLGAVTIFRRPVVNFPDVTPIHGYRNRWLRPDVQRTQEVELLAQAYFDHNIDDYQKVNVVELSVIRDGQFELQVLENVAQDYNFSVSVPDLAPGDAYRAKVFWNDGSYRVLEDTMSVYTDLRPIVDEPDFLLNPYW